MIRRILIIVLIVVVTGGLFLSYFLLYQEKVKQTMLRKDAEMSLKISRRENLVLKQKVDILKKEFDTTKTRLEAIKIQNKRLLKTVDDLNSSLKNVETELSFVTKERDLLLNKGKDDSEMIKKLQNEIVFLKQERDRMAARVEKEQPAGNLHNKEVKLEDIKVQGPEVQKPVQKKEALPKAVSAVATASGIPAEIMAFNKEYKFIVLNRGEKDGIKNAATYLVWSGGKKVGQVKADRVYESMSVFDILNSEGSFNEGMKIELRFEN